MKKILILLFFGLFFTSCGNSDENNNENANNNTSGNQEVSTGTNEEISTGNTLQTNSTTMDNSYQLEKPKSGDLVAIMKTTNGTIKIKLFQKDVPTVVNNFIGLSKKGYYNGLIFHRIIKDFMIQGGDPTGTGRGGESIYGPSFNDEFSKKLSNIRGSISMANSGPNTNGSQFFINQKDNTGLDFDKDPIESQHAVFGQVYEGIENVDAMAKAKTGPNDKPEKDIKIISVEIKKYEKTSLADYSPKVEDFIKQYKDLQEKKKEANKNRKIKKGDIISVNYTGKLTDGKVFDSSLKDGRKPIEFEVGAGKMIKGFDSGVLGMKMGEKKTLKLEPKDAYGEYNPKNIQEVPKAQLKAFEDAGIKLVAGSVLPTQYGNLKIKEVTADKVIIDTNPELAGKTLIFDIEIMGFKN